MNEYISETGDILRADVVGRRIVHSMAAKSGDFIKGTYEQAERELSYDLSKRGIDPLSYDIRHEVYFAQGGKRLATFGVHSH